MSRLGFTLSMKIFSSLSEEEKSESLILDLFDLEEFSWGLEYWEIDDWRFLRVLKGFEGNSHWD